jgi:aryl-alcohol dehydrogenase-like predicted oxidoreductase
MMPKQNGAVLGLGLIAIGRPWGHRPNPLPSESQVHELLATALDLGIRFLDTAASYGLSEQRLGGFLRTLPQDQLGQVTVATKFGDHWDARRSTAYVDHSYDALCRSLDRSLERLPKVDVLQLHKATAEVIRKPEVRKAFDYARSCGVTCWGASVKTLADARVAIEDHSFACLQLPFNRANTSLLAALELASERGKFVIGNRPFDEGKLLYETSSQGGPEVRVEAFRFILRHPFRGVVLTGTQSPAHLRENAVSFQQAGAMVAKIDNAAAPNTSVDR